MSDTAAAKTTSEQTSLEERILDLRNRQPTYINHGEALLLIGNAAASLRAQRLSDDRIVLD